MYFYSGFNPFNPPAPPPAKPPAPEKKEPSKPPANTGPLRMMILIGAGKEALLALPPNYAQAVKDATEKFEIPNNFHVRLAVKRGEEPSWLSKFVQQDFLFIADDASYQYCCAGRQVITMHVMVFEKPNTTAGPTTAAGTSCPLEIICEASSGNAFQLIANAHTDKDITKNPPIGDYIGTMSISGNPLKLTFIGRQQMGPLPKKK